MYKGTPICIPNKNHIELGQITNIQINNKNIEFAEKNQEVAISITPNISTQHYSYGRHFTHEDILVSKITKTSINAMKEFFYRDVEKHLELFKKLKKLLNLLLFY